MDANTGKMDTKFVRKNPHFDFHAGQWTDCIIEKIFKNFEIVKFITMALKGILNIVKLQSLTVKCCKMRKIRPCKVCKFCILLYYVRKVDTVFSIVVSVFCA